MNPTLAKALVIVGFALMALGAILILFSLILNWIGKRKAKQVLEAFPVAPTIGIEAEDSFINAPGAKIRNQDKSIVSKGSIINIPNSEIEDKRTKDGH